MPPRGFNLFLGIGIFMHHLMSRLLHFLTLLVFNVVWSLIQGLQIGKAFLQAMYSYGPCETSKFVCQKASYAASYTTGH